MHVAGVDAMAVVRVVVVVVRVVVTAVTVTAVTVTVTVTLTVTVSVPVSVPAVSWEMRVGIIGVGGIREVLVAHVIIILTIARVQMYPLKRLDVMVIAAAAAIVVVVVAAVVICQGGTCRVCCHHRRIGIERVCGLAKRGVGCGRRGAMFDD